MPSPTRVVFVHLMKTGGLGVSHLLREVLHEDECYPPTSAVERKVSTDLLVAEPPEVLARMRFFTVHMPAWILDVVPGPFVSATVVREPVARTVSHLRQISRTVGDGLSIGELWEKPVWRDRLTDYQVRMLGAPVPGSATSPGPEWAAAVKDADEETQQEFRDVLKPFFATGVTDTERIDEMWLGRAIARAASIDVVGVTENLGDFVARLRSVSALPIADQRVENAASDSQQPDDDLLQSIHSATGLDQQLYSFIVSAGY